MSDKNDTFRFRPDEINSKPHLERSGADEYSVARNNRYPEKTEKDNRTLIYVSIALAVVLIAVIIIGIFILIPKNEESLPEDVPEIITPSVEEEKEEKIEEEKEVISSWDMIFDPNLIYSMENGDGYIVTASFFTNNGNPVNSGEKVHITDETDIRDGGKRVSVDAFIKLIENQGGDMIFFRCTFEEKSKKVLTIKYDSSEFMPEQEIEGEEIKEEKPTTSEEEKPVEGESEEKPKEEIKEETEEEQVKEPEKETVENPTEEDTGTTTEQ